jgi:hypothetical protein
MKPLAGQYECIHRSGVGLDHFTSRIDRLTLHHNGHFVLIIQDRSRIASAAQSLLNGQQISTAAPETQREGNYSAQGNLLLLHFDDGVRWQGQLAWNGEGVQIEQNFFNKVSDSTFLPPTQRLQKDMEDVAKGLKIAGTIGSIAIKAAKTIHETVQSAQTPQQSSPQPAQSVPAAYNPAQPPPTLVSPQATSPPSDRQSSTETFYCDQCGARVRPGKHFCNQCGAWLP